MPILHIVEGPVGAGKTTFANQLGRELRAPPLILDAWMTKLFQADRPEADLWTWYAERKARCFSQIMDLARSALDHGNDAIVELGLIKVEDRLKLYADLESEGRDFLVHILQASREERKRRTLQRNLDQGQTFAMHVSEEVFEMASDMWEPIGGTERNGRDDKFHLVGGRCLES